MLLWGTNLFSCIVIHVCNFPLTIYLSFNRDILELEVYLERWVTLIIGIPNMVINIGVGIFRYKRIHVKSYHICSPLYGGACMEFSLLCLSHYGTRIGHWLGGQEILALESWTPGMKDHLAQLLTWWMIELPLQHCYEMIFHSLLEHL